MLVRETAAALAALGFDPPGLVTACRRILDRHPLSGQAKDLGSAAVGVALLMSAACWAVIAGPVLARWLGF